MTQETSLKLARALDDAGLTDLATQARNDDFHDFFSDRYATPGIALASALLEADTPAALKLRERVIAGEFDASEAESEAWADSEDGRQTLKKLIGDTPTDE